MLLIEEQARTKWCPHARAMTWEAFRDAEKPATANRGPGAQEQCLCIASKCTAWRWLWLDPNGPNVRLPEDCAAATTGEVHMRVTNEDYEPVGFCGLAGRPL